MNIPQIDGNEEGVKQVGDVKMLGDDRSKGDIKLQQGIRLFGKNEMRKYYYYNIAWGK